jgi:hypothetical protein
MSRIENSYASAVAIGVQRDVVGAVGLAGKTAPLATALLRLFVGDNSAARDIVHIMAGMAVGKAYRLGHEISRLQAEDLARAVLAWHRDGVCRVCDGHGYIQPQGAPCLSDQQCPSCRGTGRILFDRQFAVDRVELARWLAAEVEREQGRAGVEAMRKLSDQMG